MGMDRTLCSAGGKGAGRGAARCALLCFLCAFASFGPFLFQDGGFFRVWADFNWQQVPFGMALRNALAGGNIGGWCWSYELGMSTIQAFSFYALGSPFYWITLPFPAAMYPYLVGWVYLLKYTIAGVTAYLYIRRFVSQDRSAVIGALMYAFSAFQAANLMYYHFHDAVALFPLMLIGIERVLENPEDRGALVFAVFLNGLCNYYFLVTEAVFCFLYLLFRCLDGGRERRGLVRNLGNCLLCGAWGAGMAAVLLLPSALFVLGTPRARAAFSLGDLWGGFRRMLFTLRGFLLPGDTQAWQSAFYVDEFHSVAAWLPMAGISLAAASLRRRDWLGRLLPALWIIALSPLLSSGFLLFTEYSGRWLFTLTLMMALASARVIDAEKEYPAGKCLWGALAGTAVYVAAVYLLSARQTGAALLVFAPGRFLLFGGIALAGIAALLLLRRFGGLQSPAVTAVLCLFCAGTTCLTLFLYRSYAGDGTNPTNVKLGAQLEVIDDQYRYALANNQEMLPGGGSGLTVFSSAISKGTREFDSLFGYSGANHSLDKSLVRGLQELLAGRFNLVRGTSPFPTEQAVSADGVNAIVVGVDACPIGFAVDGCILREELMSIPEGDRGAALLYAAVIDPEEADAVSGTAPLLRADEIPYTEDFSAQVIRNRENAVKNFSRDSGGFRCTTDFDRDRLVYFSVPDDGGWTAFIDGKKQGILPSAGMMLLPVPSGTHEIVFSYVTPGFTAGLTVSAACWALFLLYLLLRRRGKRLTPPESAG